MRQVCKEMVERQGDYNAALGVPDEHDLGDGRVAEAGFEVVVGNANIHGVVGKVALNKAFEDVCDKAIAIVDKQL